LQAKALGRLQRALGDVSERSQNGVKISFGTDAAVFPHGQNAKEFK